MSGYSYDEDWVHIDDYEKEVKELNDELCDLKEEIEARKDNEIFTLVEIMLARDKLLNGGSIYEVIEELNRLIGYHDASVRVAAMTKINEMEVA